MSIGQSGVVDWLGIEKETGAIALTVVDDQDWRQEKEHLLVLQEKLNTYLSFIESGEVFREIQERFGRSLEPGHPIRIGILAKHELPQGAVEFLSAARSAMRAIGVSLTHKVLAVPGEDV